MFVLCLLPFSPFYSSAVTSSSVLVNLPAAGVLIIVGRYLSLDFEMRRKAATYKSKTPSVNGVSQRSTSDGPKRIIDRSDWRRKVNSPVVEEAMDQFSRHIVSEWVTDLWYSRITPDRQGPEELVLIMNGVLGEIACRMRNINLIELLTRFNRKFCCFFLLIRFYCITDESFLWVNAEILFIFCAPIWNFFEQLMLR